MPPDNEQRLVEVPQQPETPPSLIGLGYRGRQRTDKVPPCELTPSDLRRLYLDLERRSTEALNEHLATLRRPETMSEIEFKTELDAIREKAQLAVTIHSSEGEQILERSVDALSDQNLPGKVTLVYFDSAQALQFIHRDHVPQNRFYVRLDFNEPPGFNTYNPWSQPTPNTSEFSVIGPNEMWVTGVYEFVKAFFRQRGRRRRWFHSNRFFNVAHWTLGFPVALWLAARSAHYVPALQSMNPAVAGGIYIYVALVTLLVFRGLIFGLRWLFPVIEMTGSRPRFAIRGLIVVVVTSLFCSVLYDMVKFAITGR